MSLTLSPRLLMEHPLTAIIGKDGDIISLFDEEPDTPSRKRDAELISSSDDEEGEGEEETKEEESPKNIQRNPHTNLFTLLNQPAKRQRLSYGRLEPSPFVVSLRQPLEYAIIGG